MRRKEDKKITKEGEMVSGRSIKRGEKKKMKRRRREGMMKGKKKRAE